jgi:hypothetical protein
MSDVLIRFVKAARPYNANETASFTKSQARRIVSLGAAVYLDPPKGFDEKGNRLEDDDGSSIRHIGGGWHELLEFKDDDGKPIRVKGKDAAIALRDDLTIEALGEDEDEDVEVEDDESENPDDDDGND